MRFINKVGYNHPPNQLFINANELKFKDLVDFKTAQLMFKINNNLLPDCIQKMFNLRQSHYSLRGMCIYSKSKIRTNTKLRCTTVTAVNLWNTLENNLKTCSTITSFKTILKNKMINSYRLET